MTETKNLTAKLCQVMSELHRLPKTGWNDFHKYNYVTESDVVEAVRFHLSSRGVFLFPDVIEHKREPRQGGKGYISDIMVRWTFLDSESGESLSMTMPGSGEDVGEKSLYKALTGSSKYLLLKTFLIASGEDPEKDDTAIAKEIAAAPLPTHPQQPGQIPTPQAPVYQGPDPGFIKPLMPAYQGPPKTAPVNGGQVWQGQLMGVEAKTITSKKTGQPYVIHEFKIALEDGVATAGAGFNEELVNAGKLAVGKMIRAQIVAGQKRGFWNIESFEVLL